MDAHSKWPEAIPRGSTTATDKTITILRNLLATYGLPEELVSDNGPQFTADHFRGIPDWTQRNWAQPTGQRPTGQRSGLCRFWRRAWRTNPAAALLLSIIWRIPYWHTGRLTPHITTCVSPAELFLECQPQRTCLSMVKPDLETAMHQKQQQQQQAHDHNTNRLRSFLPGDSRRAPVPWPAGKVSPRWSNTAPWPRVVHGSNQQGQPCPHRSPSGGHGNGLIQRRTAGSDPYRKTTTLDPRVQMLRCVTPHTPLTLPQRCCRLCQKPTHQGQRTAEVPGTPAKASNRPERGMAKNPAKEPERSSPGGRYPARTRKPPERLDLLKALTVPVTDKAECAERQTQKHSLVLFSFRRPRVRHHERSSVLISYCLNRYHVVPIRVEVLDHNFFALHAQKRGCLLGKGTEGGGGVEERVKARLRIPAEKDRRDRGPPPEQWKC